MREIDWEELAEVEDGYCQTFYDADLSAVYVSGEGDNPEAFIIGEAPGAQEEAQRRPFVGPAGVVMRDLMALAGLYASIPRDGKPHVINNEHGLENCWLTNVIKFRPPRNRKPLPAEVIEARPWLRREWIAVGKPQLIIPVGGTALEAVTGKRVSILRAAGKCHKARSRCGLELFVWPMVHPSFGLRTPAVQPLLEQDWERLAAWRKERATNS